MNNNYRILPGYIGGEGDYQINCANERVEQHLNDLRKDVSKDNPLTLADVREWNYHGEDELYYDLRERYIDECVGWTDMSGAQLVSTKVPYCRREVLCIELPEPTNLDIGSFNQYLIKKYKEEIEDLEAQIEDLREIIHDIEEEGEEES